MSCAYTFFGVKLGVCVFPRLALVRTYIKFCVCSDWLRNLAPLFPPIRSKIETTRDLLAGKFPRSASATFITIEL